MNAKSYASHLLWFARWTLNIYSRHIWKWLVETSFICNYFPHDCWDRGQPAFHLTGKTQHLHRGPQMSAVHNLKQGYSALSKEAIHAYVATFSCILVDKLRAYILIRTAWSIVHLKRVWTHEVKIWIFPFPFLFLHLYSSSFQYLLYLFSQNIFKS